MLLSSNVVAMFLYRCPIVKVNVTVSLMMYKS
jgi:hypothetical protein